MRLVNKNFIQTKKNKVFIKKDIDKLRVCAFDATEVEEIKERLVNEEGLEIDKITDTRMKSGL